MKLQSSLLAILARGSTSEVLLTRSWMKANCKRCGQGLLAKTSF
jgi:hypothetical protein